MFNEQTAMTARELYRIACKRVNDLNRLMGAPQLPSFDDSPDYVKIPWLELANYLLSHGLTSRELLFENAKDVISG